AFDHEALARGLSTAAGGTRFKADRLPFDEIEFIEDGKAIRFRVGGTTWACNLANYECSKANAAAGAPGPAAESNPPRRRRAQQRDVDDSQPGGVVRSPDQKWTGFVKDHNVFVRREGEPAEIRLSEDGKPGLGYGRLAWSRDSKTLVAFRIEPGDRKEV